ncbi:NADP-dependent isocitrate dehydrogenase, partial [[Kluyvera] intestini]
EAVKSFARKHPHRMGAWDSSSKTSVATMDADDFRHNEQSVVIEAGGELSIVHVGADGSETVLKQSIPVLDGEVVDSTVMRAEALDAFLRAQVAAAKEQGVLFSLHMKATMMKVSDPIIFGHAVRAFFP